ncbi:MAG: sigma-70 family RNA polymerase sigma factor [Chloroflexi bacterium]|nr:sigma-70 family RNA polymerase sigma factor [Chloroflexota bacterium]
MQDEAALLERISQYDTAALAQVYDAYYDRIYHYVYGYVGRVNPAEDITATVFFRLLDAVRRGNSPRKNLSAWLYRVAHNLVIDTFRRKRPEELELAEWLESDAPDPAHSAELQLQTDRLRLALAELTEAQHQVIMLKFFQGLDSREAAEVIGKSEGAVDALQHRALEALRKTLREGPGSGPSGKLATIGGSEEDVEKRTDTAGQMHMSAACLARLLTWLLPEGPCCIPNVLPSDRIVAQSPKLLPRRERGERLWNRKAGRWRMA